MVPEYWFSCSAIKMCQMLRRKEIVEADAWAREWTERAELARHLKGSLCQMPASPHARRAVYPICGDGDGSGPVRRGQPTRAAGLRGVERQKVSLGPVDRSIGY